MRIGFRVSSTLCLVGLACGSPSADRVVDDPAGLAAPAGDGEKADGLYSVTGLRRWSLIGNAVTPGDDALELTVLAPESTQTIDAWLDSNPGIRLAKQDGTFVLSMGLGAVEPGTHTIRFAVDGSPVTTFSRTFERTHPLYVFVSNDWDTPDNADATLRRQEALREQHPELKLTHFVGPYTFTDRSISEARRKVLIDWVKSQRELYDDEIGLHIHPYCSFVEAAGVACRIQPSFAYQSDSTGYTVVLASYDEAETGALLAKADELFLANGLGKPTSFRAGGWTAVSHTLKALGDHGYVADASPANWRRLEEWQGRPNASIYEWNQEHWTTVNDTSQPYHPNVEDADSRLTPQLPILAIPDNGALVDYVSSNEMIDVFRANFDGTPLNFPTVVSIGYHPPNFGETYLARMQGALDHIDGFLASADRGPVVYARASELARLEW